ncbi:AraC family transcriptional regulator [Gordonia terrae]
MHKSERSPGRLGREDSAGTVSLRTRELDTSEGRAKWQNTLGGIYCRMDISWPDPRREFDAEWSGRQLGDLHISTVRADEQSIIRSPAMIRSDSAADYLVNVVIAGEVNVQQSNRTSRLHDGAFALLNLAEPFVVTAPGPFTQVAVRIPRHMIGSRVPGTWLERAAGRSFGCDGPASIVGRLMSELAAAQDLSPAISASFAASAIDMLATTVIEAVPVPAAAQICQARDLARIRQIIGEHLHDPELTLSDVAAMSGMSLRKVQKLVHTVGVTPSTLLHTARVEQAKIYLLTTEMSVAEVGASVGFGDTSHFSRVFRRHTHCSPGRYRATQAMTT